MEKLKEVELKHFSSEYMQGLNAFVLTEEQNNFLHCRAILRKLMKDSIAL